MVIPNLVRQALVNEPLTVFGDGNQTRCFAHVRDIVPVLIDLVSRPAAYGSVFNVGTQEEVSIKVLAERIIEMTESSSTIRYIPYNLAYAPGFEDMERRVPDLTRLRRLIGYQPLYNLNDILRDVIVDGREKLESTETLLYQVA